MKSIEVLWNPNRRHEMFFRRICVGTDPRNVSVPPVPRAKERKQLQPPSYRRSVYTPRVVLDTFLSYFDAFYDRGINSTIPLICFLNDRGSVKHRRVANLVWKVAFLYTRAMGLYSSGCKYFRLSQFSDDVWGSSSQEGASEKLG